jgi:predicted dehydrogenase
MSGGGVHLIDLLVWLTGERPTNVMAMGNNISTVGTAFRYRDYVAATMQFKSGMVARITANFGCVHPHQHALRVFGTAGTFILDDAGPRFWSTRDPATPSLRMNLATGSISKGALIPDFVRAVREDEDLNAETQSHFDVMSIIEACNSSLKTSSVTEVEYV